MTRYTITCPRKTNTGESTREARWAVETNLHNYFGGWTRTRGTGCWSGAQDYREPVDIYVCDSQEPQHVALRELAAIARAFKQNARQEAVYITWQPIEARLV